MKKQQAYFDDLDALSTERKSFFFIIDFLAEKIEVYTSEELLKENISVYFPCFSSEKEYSLKNKKIFWEIYPQSLQEYEKGYSSIQKYLRKGDFYLINYTCKTQVQTNLSLDDIFYQSKAKYKILYKNNWCCFSPETFIKIEDHSISTYPMKGTIDASLPDARQKLKESVKERAEHYTVVDLLRNDLSIVSDNVTVKDFQRIDYLKTVQKNLYAMSSEISGEIKPEFQNKIGSILKELLPAGSILGAPKAKVLSVTLQTETYDRGFYTGVAGWFDGQNLDSCVMIRFIEKENEKFYFKSGGGITHMSKLEEEYEEMKNKIYVPIH